MKAYQNITCLGALLLLISVSCVKETVEPYVGDQELKRFPISLSLNVVAVEDGTPQTKTIMDPDNLDPLDPAYHEGQIANVLVLQFDGVTSTAPIVGGQSNFFDHWPLVGDEEVTLMAPTENTSTVVVLANIEPPVSEGQPPLDFVNSLTTLGSFLAQDFKSISSLSDVLYTTGDDSYFRMSGTYYLSEFTAGYAFTVNLKRNVAKVMVNITNNSYANGDEGDPDVITISKVQLCGINGKHYYLTHITPNPSNPDPAVNFSDPYSSAYPYRFDNDQEDFDTAGNDSGVMQSYSYYIPANLRGTIDNDYEFSKGQFAPDGATCFRIYGTYGASIPINYTYYLGRNLTDDFNLEPNHKYTYNLSINKKGDAHFDSRIEDLSEVVFQTDANSYMLHPPKVEGQTRIYAFPVRRPAVFWNPEGVNLGVYGASTLDAYGGPYTNYVLDENTEWTAEILWSDFNMSSYLSGPNKFLYVDSGTGFDPTNPAHTNPYIKIRVTAGMKGNVVVAMKSEIDDGDEDPDNNVKILWSWHLWITDYDPDVVMEPVSGKYIYPVPNGEIHRYNNALFNNAEPTSTAIGYKYGFAMDRNLGALGVAYSVNGSHGLYYQFGRKDPFIDRNQSNDRGRLYLGGITSSGWPGGKATGIPGSTASNMCYATTHPLNLYTGTQPYSWRSSADVLAVTGRLWCDALFYQHIGNQVLLEEKKSIYDPCPPGWKVPVTGTCNGFNFRNSDNEGAGTYTTLFADSGRYYYPEGYVNAARTGAIYFPAAGYRHSSEYSPVGIGGNGYYNSASPTGQGQVIGFGFTSSSYSPDWWELQANAYPLRCVRE